MEGEAKVIYFVRAGSDGPVKIGWAKNISARMKEIQTGCFAKLHVVRHIDGDPWVEGWFHQRFAHFRLEGEWFTFDPEILETEPPVERQRYVRPNGRGELRSAALHFRVTKEKAAEMEALAEKEGVPIATLAHTLIMEAYSARGGLPRDYSN